MTTMLRGVLLAASLLLPAAAAAQGRLPAIEAEDLTGAERALPGGLGGEVNLLIVAFERDQTETIDSWLKTARAARVQVPRLDYYGIPVLPRGLGLIGRLIENGMRERYPDPTDQSHVVVLYTSASKLREALGIGAGTEVRAVLVDRAGEVLWQRTGAAGADAEAALVAAVKKALPAR